MHYISNEKNFYYMVIESFRRSAEVFQELLQGPVKIRCGSGHLWQLNSSYLIRREEVYKAI